LQTGTVVERSDGFYIRYYKDVMGVSEQRSLSAFAT